MPSAAAPTLAAPLAPVRTPSPAAGGTISYSKTIDGFDVADGRVELNRGQFSSMNLTLGGEEGKIGVAELTMKGSNLSTGTAHATIQIEFRLREGKVPDDSVKALRELFEEPQNVVAEGKSITDSALVKKIFELGVVTSLSGSNFLLKGNSLESPLALDGVRLGRAAAPLSNVVVDYATLEGSAIGGALDTFVVKNSSLRSACISLESARSSKFDNCNLIHAKLDGMWGDTSLLQCDLRATTMGARGQAFRFEPALIDRALKLLGGSRIDELTKFHKSLDAATLVARTNEELNPSIPERDQTARQILDSIRRSPAIEIVPGKSNEASIFARVGARRAVSVTVSAEDLPRQVFHSSVKLHDLTDARESTDLPSVYGINTARAFFSYLRGEEDRVIATLAPMPSASAPATGRSRVVPMPEAAPPISSPESSDAPPSNSGAPSGGLVIRPTKPTSRRAESVPPPEEEDPHVAAKAALVESLGKLFKLDSFRAAFQLIDSDDGNGYIEELASRMMRLSPTDRERLLDTKDANLFWKGYELDDSRTDSQARFAGRIPDVLDARERLDLYRLAIDSGRLLPDQEVTSTGPWQRGSLVDLREWDGEVVFIGDVHARGENIDKILDEPDEAGKTVRQKLEEGTVKVIFLGDIIHSEEECATMDTSVSALEIVMSLKSKFPSDVYSLAGEHDLVESTSECVRNWVGQTTAYCKYLKDEYGDTYMEGSSEAAQRLPLMVIGKDYFAVHGAPPTSANSLDEVAEAEIGVELAPIADEALRGNFHDEGSIEFIEVMKKKTDYTPESVSEFLPKVGLPPDAIMIGGHHRVDGDHVNFHMVREPIEFPFRIHILFACNETLGYGRIRDGIFEEVPVPAVAA